VSHGKHLADLLRLPDRQLDQLIQLGLDQHQLITYGVDRSERLFFPSTGIFALPVVDTASPTGVDFAYAVPITPRLFVARLSKTADLEAFGRLAKNGGYYMGMSVGLDAEKVVIPPDFILANSKQHLGEAIRKWRQASRGAISGIVKLQDFRARVEEGMGLQFDIHSALERATQKVPTS
jgi:hypothetical protein